MRWQRRITYALLIIPLFFNAGTVFAEDDGMFGPMPDSSASYDVPMSAEEAMQDIGYTEREEEYTPGIASIPLGNSMFTGDYLPQDVTESRMFRPSSEGETMTLPEEMTEGAKKITREEKKAEPAGTKGWNLIDYIFARTRPYVFADCAYDSNIWLVQTGKKDDFVNVTRPGALFAIGRKERGQAKGSDRFELEGGMKVSTYAYSGFNRQHPYASIKADTGRNHYRFSFNNFFKQDFTQSSWLTDNQPGFVNYILNVTGIKGAATYNRFGIEAIYKRMTYGFASDSSYSASNLETNGMVLTGLYRPMEMKKTAFISEFHYGKAMYPKAESTAAKDYSYYFVYMGIKGRFTKKVTGLIKTGFESNNYVSGKIKSNFPVMIMLNYRFSPKTTFLFGAKESGISSVNSAMGQYTGTYAMLHCLHNLTPKIRADLGVNIYSIKWTIPKRVDTGNGFSAKLEYRQNKQSKFTAEYNYATKTSRAGFNAGFKDMVAALRAEILF